MTQDLLGTQSVLDDRSERARRAVRAFRAMQPGLTGYARAMTGRRNVIVELAQGVPRTDGKKIFFRPPMALGDRTPHQRANCDKRDPKTRLQKCEACRVREEVLITICHEIAHIAYGTFEETSEAAKDKALKKAIEEHGTKYAKQIQQVLLTKQATEYLSLSGLVSPYLPVLVNALEDCRVDEAMFKARKGTKVMFDAYVHSVFDKGVEGDDGSLSEWRDRPLNSQILIGVFALACGYKYAGWFHEDIEKALEDQKLRELAARVDTVRSAEGTYDLAFPILARLRELGFCKSDHDPEDEEEENEDEQSGESDDAGESGAGDEAEDEGDQDNSSEAEDGPSSGEGAEGDSGDSDEASDADEADSGGDQDSGSESPDPGGDGQDDSGSESGTDSDGPGSEEDGSEDDGSGSDSPAEVDRGGAGGTELPESGDAGRPEDGDPAESEQGDGDSPDEELTDEADADGAEPSSEEGGDGGEDQQEGEDPADPLADPDRDGDGDDSDADDGSELSDDGDSDESGALEGDDSGEVVDSGADEGKGGTELKNTPDYGGPDEALHDVQVFSGHEVMHAEETTPSTSEERADNDALDRAIIQSMYFETPSANVEGVREHFWGQPLYVNGKNMSSAWADRWNSRAYEKQALRVELGIDTDTSVPESVLGPALIQMRRTFTDNARAKKERHLKSGKINAKVLGKRGFVNDERLFHKKRLPGKRSYAVLMGIDISGSTIGLNLALAKRAAMAQAELCNRTGVDFAVYAHTANGSWDSWSYNELWLDMYEIKSFEKPWDSTAQEALDQIGSDSENLDGHGLEYYRKMIERHPATDKVILYYSDGKMPAANHDEELEILQREIQYCKSHKITLLGVGIRTDSPRRHGLDTVQVDDDADLGKVVRHLESALLHNR